MGILEARLREKNQVTDKDYFQLPKAFSRKKMYDVLEALKQDGYSIYDLIIDGKKLHLARIQEFEIYFNNNEAVCAVSDYNRVEMKSFPVAIEGNCSVGTTPLSTWLHI